MPILNNMELDNKDRPSMASKGKSIYPIFFTINSSNNNSILIISYVELECMEQPEQVTTACIPATDNKGDIKLEAVYFYFKGYRTHILNLINIILFSSKLFIN
jgi:hypothetical protein